MTRCGRTKCEPGCTYCAFLAEWNRIKREGSPEWDAITKDGQPILEQKTNNGRENNMATKQIRRDYILGDIIKENSTDPGGNLITTPFALQLTNEQAASIEGLAFPRFHKGNRVYMDPRTNTLYLNYNDMPEELKNPGNTPAPVTGHELKGDTTETTEDTLKTERSTPMKNRNPSNSPLPDRKCKSKKADVTEPPAKKVKPNMWSTDAVPGGITLTEKQITWLIGMPVCGFWDDGLDSSPWLDVFADTMDKSEVMSPMTFGAITTTLREKGIITIAHKTENKHSPAFFRLTETGKIVARELGIK